MKKGGNGIIAFLLHSELELRIIYIALNVPSSFGESDVSLFGIHGAGGVRWNSVPPISDRSSFIVLSLSNSYCKRSLRSGVNRFENISHCQILTRAYFCYYHIKL